MSCVPLQITPLFTISHNVKLLLKLTLIVRSSTASKVSVFGVFLVHAFPHSGYSRIIPIFSVSLLIQSECGKIRTRKIPHTYTFHAKIIIQFCRVEEGPIIKPTTVTFLTSCRKGSFRLCQCQ